jgi:hypothetical protein
LIYIPQQMLQMDPIEILGRVPGTLPGRAPAPVDLNAGGALDILSSMKFTYELKIPPKAPKDIGYFLVQAKINIEGELKQESGVVKLGFKKGQVKAAIEKKLTDDTKATFAMKFEEKTLAPIAEAVKKRSVKEFTRAVFGALEGTIKTSFKWGRFSLVPEAGLEASITPVIIRIAGEWEDRLPIEGAVFKGKFVIKGGFNVGLSAKGWAWIVERLGAEAVKDFLVGTGERALATVAEYLLAEGVLVAGAIAAGALVGALSMTCLMAWATEHARHTGALEGTATWYVTAYANKVFGDSRPSGFVAVNAALRDQLIVIGEKDAALAARAYLTKINDPAGRGSDREALEAFRQILLAADNGNYSTAKWRLKKSVEEKSKKLVGL